MDRSHVSYEQVYLQGTSHLLRDSESPTEQKIGLRGKELEKTNLSYSTATDNLITSTKKASI